MRKRTFEGGVIPFSAVTIGSALLGCNRAETTTHAEPSAAALERVAPATAPPPAAAALPSSSASSGASSGRDPCADLCARSRELGCAKAGDCPTECREMLSGAACADQLSIALRCFVGQPISSFECGDTGMAAVKDGFCEAEQARYVDCIAKATGNAP
jgi:hypothetical protein